MLNEKIQLVSAYKKIFETEDGKLVLQDLIKECRVLSPTMGKDTNLVLFNEGKRNVGLYILEHINMDLSALLKLSERQSEEKMNEY